MGKRITKTITVKVLQGYYDSGWEDLCQYRVDDPEQAKEAKDDYRAYEENERNPHRIITRRIPNPEYKGNGTDVLQN